MVLTWPATRCLPSMRNGKTRKLWQGSQTMIFLIIKRRIILWPMIRLPCPWMNLTSFLRMYRTRPGIRTVFRRQSWNSLTQQAGFVCSGCQWTSRRWWMRKKKKSRQRRLIRKLWIQARFMREYLMPCPGIILICIMSIWRRVNIPNTDPGPRRARGRQKNEGLISSRKAWKIPRILFMRKIWNCLRRRLIKRNCWKKSGNTGHAFIITVCW